MAPMQDQQYLSAGSEPIVTPIAQKRTGLVRLSISNDTNRRRLVAISAPIGGQSRGLGCDVGTSMSFYGTPVAQVFIDRVMSLFRGNQAMIRPQAGNQFSLDVNAHIDEW